VGRKKNEAAPTALSGGLLIFRTAMGVSPNFSGVRDVHWQAPDNAANGHLGRARRVKHFL
jgi:hypothetical protein